MPDIYIINLESNKDRKALIKAQFARLATPLQYTFFPAVHGKENPEHPLFKKYNAKERLKRKGSPLTLSQLGCFASHYLLWQQCLEKQRPMLILEDDAAFQDNFLAVWHYLNSAENTHHLLWLSEPSFPKTLNKTTLIESHAQFNIYRYYKGWKNTMAYYITPKAAKTLLEFTQEWIYEVDITMERYWQHKIANLGIAPYCIKLNPECHYSNINLGKKQQKTFINKIKREYHEGKDRLARLIYNLTHP